MKSRLWWAGVAILLSLSVQGQSLTGIWQGVENETGEPSYWPSELRLQTGKGPNLFGVLYQEVGELPQKSATFQMEGARTAAGMRLEHVRKLNETGHTPFSYWCDGAITFTYDASQEKLIGHATYRPVGDCDVGTFTLYRIKLKSAATVAAGALSTLRVSGRNVHWYADAELKQPLAVGNTYRTKLSRTTTFYLTQRYYPTSQSSVIPITIRVAGTVAAAKPTPPPPAPPAAPLSSPDSASRYRAPGAAAGSHAGGTAHSIIPPGHARIITRSRPHSGSAGHGAKGAACAARARGGPHRPDWRAGQKPDFVGRAGRGRKKRIW